MERGRCKVHISPIVTFLKDNLILQCFLSKPFIILSGSSLEHPRCFLWYKLPNNTHVHERSGTPHRAAYDARMICEEGGPPREHKLKLRRRDDPENEIDPIDIHPFSKRREG